MDNIFFDGGLKMYMIGLAVSVFAYITVNDDDLYSAFDLCDPRTSDKMNIFFYVFYKKSFVRNHRIVCTILPIALMLPGLFYNRLPRLSLGIASLIVFAGLFFLLLQSSGGGGKRYYYYSKLYPSWVFCELKNQAIGKGTIDITISELDSLYKACSAYTKLCARVHLADVISGLFALIYLCCNLIKG